MITGKHTGGPVPCGQCRLCRQNRRDKKTARITLETQMHEHSLFITLTYSDKYLPVQYTHPKTGKYYSHPKGTLSPCEIKNFMKRLRRRFPPKQLRCFYAGEYGDEERPHFHILLWGAPFDKATKQKIFAAWSDPDTGDLKCNPERLDIQVPRSDWDVARYCAAYIVKGMTNESDLRQNGFTGSTNAEKLAGRYPEFSRGSLGIGSLAIPALVASLSGKSGSNSIQLQGDIPRTFHLHGKQMPLDRYMREKILDGLQIKEKIKDTHFSNYEKEMRDLYVRARSNKKIPSSWTLAPFDQACPKERAWALENQMKHEQAQSVLLKLQRSQLKKAEKNG